MTRSLKSIKRRAEKRGRSVEEQLKVEAEKTFKKSNSRGEALEASSNREDDGEGRACTRNKLDPRLEGGWKCSHCKNDNFAARIECNRCCRRKPNRKQDPATKCTSSSASVLPQRGGSGAWGLQASEEKIKENEVLRLLYRLVEEGSTDQEVLERWNALSDEEQNRAKTLVLRSQRKLEKKRPTRQRLKGNNDDVQSAQFL
jgi:hypothetical protein